MELALISSARGTKVFQDQKHVKTIAKKYALVYSKVNSKMTFDKKRLNPDERKALEIQIEYAKFLEKVAKKEPLLHRLIKDATPTAARMVITPCGERMQLQLDNNMQVTIHSVRLFNLFPHTSPSYQNY